MDKKKALVISIYFLIGILAVACSGSGAGQPEPTNTGSQTTPFPTLDPEIKTPPIDRNYVGPGKVEIGNFFPGARAEYPLTVHNGNSFETNFAVEYQIPSKVPEDTSMPSTEVEAWVQITDPSPVIDGYGTEEILIILEMPEDAKPPGSKWEFWISVFDNSQGGMVVTKLASRWIVTMR